ncbi:hypothetical protein PtA15_7A523 [Puccinia triticina]|uniref:Uncharacterized protein n=1 Tax=Puccinia triticina TaxID=208348 RepID=A0ABY7CNQ5_9BASI|nr:uncharacterized protein PtA15_7A523 [Puccinia triticina]WAQ86794.1 hypothetical protein PtA15_7A523 [Puccinia triticina]
MDKDLKTKLPIKLDRMLPIKLDRMLPIKLNQPRKPINKHMKKDNKDQYDEDEDEDTLPSPSSLFPVSDPTLDPSLDFL